MSPFEVATVAYGRAAVDALAVVVGAAKGGDPLAPVTVVVPTNYAAVATRRALAANGPGVAAVSFLTLHRLAERLGGASLAAAGRRPLSAPVLAQAVRRMLAEAPGMFAPVAGHPATEQALVAASRELAAVSDEHLDALAGASTRAGDVVAIHRRAREILAPSWHDEHDLLEAATAALGQGAPAPGPVIVHLPQGLSSAGATLLGALAAAGTVTVMVARSGEAAADEAVLRALHRAGIGAGPATATTPARASRIVSVSDPDEEVRTVVRLVVGAARQGVPFARMAVVYGTADPYARLVHEQLAAAGIPSNGVPVRTVGEALVGRTLRSLLALPDHGFRRDGVLALVSSSRLLGTDGRWAPARAWERVSRDAGVVDGDDWQVRLATHAGAQRARADEAEADERPSSAARYRREADHADSLAAFVAGLAHDLDAGQATTGWRAMAAWAQCLVARYLGGQRGRARWPEEERQAAERVEAMLDGLGGLDALGGPAPTLELFRRTLDAELEGALRRVGRFGQGVLVGPVSVATGVCVERLFVLGLAEGAFPGPRLEDSLLSDQERALTGGELELRADRLHAERRHLLAALAGAGEATLCFPRGDLRRPGDRTASRWLLQDAAHLAGRERLYTAELSALGDQPWFEEVASFTSGAARSSFPATAQDYRLAALLRRGSGPLNAAAEVSGDGVLAAGVALSEARRSAAFTRFDGNLVGLALTDLADGVTVVSATRLQAWATCPHAYLLGHVLHIDVAEDPERVLEITALDRGSLVHGVLDRFLNEAIGAGVPEGSWPRSWHDRMREITEECCDDYEARGLTGRSLFWRRDRTRLLADLDRFLHKDAAFRTSRGARPVAAEHAFGLRDAPHGPVALQIADGRSLLLRGAADRVDQAGGQGWIVTDYKTGGTRSYQGLTSESPHDEGTHLQLAVYAAAVRAAFAAGTEADVPVHADYWFTSAKGNIERIGYLVDDVVMASVASALTTIADGVAGGVFPARPAAEPAWGYVACRYCDPDGLGTAELRRSWERKRSDPALAGYAGLCEPEALDAPA